jgi:hypothetical protein
MLRKPDERRQLTQRWRFTEGGRLMSSHHGLYVQAKDGFMGLKRGIVNEGILGKMQWPRFHICRFRTRRKGVWGMADV